MYFTQYLHTIILVAFLSSVYAFDQSIHSSCSWSREGSLSRIIVYLNSTPTPFLQEAPTLGWKFCSFLPKQLEDFLSRIMHNKLLWQWATPSYFYPCDLGLTNGETSREVSRGYRSHYWSQRWNLGVLTDNFPFGVEIISRNTSKLLLQRELP